MRSAVIAQTGRHTWYDHVTLHGLQTNPSTGEPPVNTTRMEQYTGTTCEPHLKTSISFEPYQQFFLSAPSTSLSTFGETSARTALRKPIIWKVHPLSTSVLKKGITVIFMETWPVILYSAKTTLGCIVPKTRNSAVPRAPKQPHNFGLEANEIMTSPPFQQTIAATKKTDYNNNNNKKTITRTKTICLYRVN